jgi:hypothetical protein
LGSEEAESLIKVATDVTLAAAASWAISLLMVSEPCDPAPDDEDAVTGRIVVDSKLVSTTGGRASCLSLSLSNSSCWMGVGVFRADPSREKLQLVGENKESFRTVSAAEEVVEKRLACLSVTSSAELCCLLGTFEE